MDTQRANGKPVRLSTYVLGLTLALLMIGLIGTLTGAYDVLGDVLVFAAIVAAVYGVIHWRRSRRE